MNNRKILIVFGVCAFAGVVMAGPGRGGPGGHGGFGGRGGPAPRQMQAPRGGGHTVRPAPARPAVRPAPRPGPGFHARHAPPPPRHHFRHPVGARFWCRPPCPPPRFGALRAWVWVATVWNMTIDGVYYYGDGYYYDGYNYYYNGAYYTVPPGTTIIVNEPPVVCW